MTLKSKPRRFPQVGILLPLLLVGLVTISGCITQVSKKESDPNGAEKVTKAVDPAGQQPKGPPRPLDLSYIPADTMAALVLAPSQILSADIVQLYPIEVLEVLSERDLGVNVKEIEQVIGLAQMSAEAPEPQFGLIVRLSKSHQLDDLFPSAQKAEIVEKEEIDGRQFRRINENPPIRFTMPDDKTVLLGLGDYVSQMLATKDADSPLIKLLKQVDANHEAVAIVSTDMIPKVFKDMVTGPEAVPPVLIPYLGALEQLSALEINIDVSAQLGGELVLHAHDPEEAEQLEATILQGLEFAKQMLLAQASQTDSGDPLIDAAMQRYLARLGEHLVKLFRPTRDASRLSLDSDATIGVAGTGVMVAMLLPAVSSARFAARKMSSSNNLKQIGIAIHNYHDTYRQFPVGESPAIKYEDGKQLLSWRVHLLPFIDEDVLYRQFKLDEPWDSPHNMELLDQIPYAYVTPHHDLGNRTVYVAPLGPDTMLGSGKPTRFRDVTDGTSQTIMVIEAGPERAVPWTKPDDLTIDKDDPVGSVGAEKNTFQVLFGDGSVHSLSIGIEPSQFNWLIQMRDGNPIKRDVFDTP